MEHVIRIVISSKGGLPTMQVSMTDEATAELVLNAAEQFNFMIRASLDARAKDAGYASFKEAPKTFIKTLKAKDLKV